MTTRSSFRAKTRNPHCTVLQKSMDSGSGSGMTATRALLMSTFTRIIQEIRQLTPRQLAFRVGYEFFNRTGLRKRLEPVGQAPALDNLPTQKEWLASLPEDHLLWRWRRDTENGTAASVLRKLLSEAEQQALIER